MSTRKDTQDLIKQAQSISDSIIPKIPKSLVQQSKSWYAASKAFGPGRLTSATFKIPSSTIKRLECLGSAYKIPEPAIPKDALKGIREHVMLSSAAYSIGSNSKLTELFDSGVMKSIRQQQKLFDSVHAIASTINIPNFQKPCFSIGAETVREYMDSVKSIEHIFNSLPNVTIPAMSFQSALKSVAIPDSDESLISFIDSTHNIAINEYSVDIPDELANAVSQEAKLPEGTFKESAKKGFVSVARNVFEAVIAGIIVQIIIALIFASPNAPVVAILEDIHDALFDGIHEIVVEERQQTSEEKKQTLELQKQTKEDQEQTKLLKQLVDNSSDLKER
ncbi:MAG: hypothetical protein HFE75_11450 [Firmicutes bacterium]|nr:hypothetical protein [Bacillota bacterium]